ncbi:hypothetical protein [Niveibacterium sp. SC-1]|uniref:hypothetical protein n=1 Tax=Niveibacterium sp. SC-1 TaxID=3135646 RepID=UPI00311F24B9
MPTLRSVLASLFVCTLIACGGGGSPSAGSTEAGAQASGSASPPAAGTQLGEVRVLGEPGASGPRVTSFGFTLPAGLAKDGLVAVRNGTALPTQVDVKRRHPDGTIRHAILSVALPDAETSPLAIVSAAGNPLNKPALTPAQILSGPINYVVQITEDGRTWQTSLREALAGKPSPWLQGALQSEWRGRVAPTAGGAAHPALRVVFDARFESISRGRVSITLDNVESTEARGDRSYSLRILDAGGKLIEDRPLQTHYNQTRYRKVYLFGGASSQIVLPDLALLKRAHAIANYTDADLGSAPASSLYNYWMASKRDTFDSGIIRSNMPDSGGRMDIGPLPGWTVIALLSGAANAYQVMYDAADRAGVFSVHYLDKDGSGRIPSIDKYPTMTVGGGAEWSQPADKLPATKLPRTSPHQVDTAHQPSLSFIPYLLTGDRYYLDELYYWAGWNLLQLHWDYRNKAAGIVKAEQVRAMGWSLRTQAQAAWAAPDGDWEGPYFASKIENNAGYMRTSVMPRNGIGLYRGWGDMGSTAQSPEGNLSSEVAYWVSPWMHDFHAISWSQICDLGLGGCDVRDWLLGFTVKRFTSGTDFNRMDGTAYRLAGDLKSGKPITTMSELYAYSFANRSGPAPTTLLYTGDPGGYAIQAFATLAVANDAGLPKADEAYRFVRDELIKKGGLGAFLSDPTWNLMSAAPVAGISGSTRLNAGGGSGTSGGADSSGGGNGGSSGTSTLPVVDNLPREADLGIKASWFASLPLNQWTEVPGSRLLDNIAVPTGSYNRADGVNIHFNAYDLLSIVYAWGGAAYDGKRNGLHLFGGGHNDGKWNGLLFFSLDSYRWSITDQGSPPNAILGTKDSWGSDAKGNGLNADNKPMASHMWYGIAYIPETDELFLGARNNALYSFKDKAWRQPILDYKHSYWANDIQAWPYKGKIYQFCGGLAGSEMKEYGGKLFDPALTTTNNDGSQGLGRYSDLSSLPSHFKCLWEQWAVNMPERGEVFRFRPGDPDNKPQVLKLDNLGQSYEIDTFNKGWDALRNLPGFTPQSPLANGAVAFAPGTSRAQDRVYVLEQGASGRLWELNPNDWSGRVITTTGTQPPGSRYGYYGRFVYDRKHKVLMALYSVRTSDGETLVPNVRIIRVQ